MDLGTLDLNPGFRIRVEACGGRVYVARAQERGPRGWEDVGTVRHHRLDDAHTVFAVVREAFPEFARRSGLYQCEG